MTRFTLAFLPAVALLGLTACSDDTMPEDETAAETETAGDDMTETGDVMAETVTVTGSLAYRERIALRPGASARVMLLDTSRADAEAEVLAEEVIDLGDRQPPVPFELSADGSDFNSQGTYAVRGEILGRNGRVQWTTDTAHLIDPTEANNALGVLTLVRANGGGNDAPDAGETDGPAMATWTCGDQTVTVEYPDEDSARVTWGAASFDLDRVQAASGSRYEIVGGNVVFWERGDEATLEIAGEEYPVCTRG